MSIPLIQHRQSDAPVAYRPDGVVSAGQFIHDVRSLAANLPERRYVINLCGDRYRFAVGLCAALLRKQISLLPPNYTPGFVASLREEFPGLYGITDSALSDIDIDRFEFPALTNAGASNFDMPAIEPQQIAAYVFTSGSTGRPTSHVKTWGGLARGAQAQAERFALVPGSHTTLIGTVPPQHMYGLESSLILALQTGVSFFGGHPFYPADIRAALARLPGARILVTTPFHLRALLSDDAIVPTLSCLVSATAPLPLDLAELAETKLGAPLFEVYGCTEAGQVATRRTVIDPTWQTYRDIRIYARGDEVFTQGGSVEQEAKLLDVIDVIDAQHFVLHGRTADVINIAGKRTSLANLNYHLNEIPGVNDGVFFMPEEQGAGITRLTALVVAPALTQAQLTTALRARIDAAFLPRPIYFVDTLPRNSTGKLPHEAVAALVLRLRG
jgi:acyl-coenzyme A synthetase/AMP-(fatty) acid ligase